MKKQLLLDYIYFNKNNNTRKINEGGKLKTIKRLSNSSNDVLNVRGILQKAEEKNQNNRVYPKSVLIREVNKFNKLIDNRRSLGELDHPDRASVNLSNSSHLITKLWWEGNDLWGDIEILSTPSGNILKELFKSNISVGISSRGLGSLEENNDGTLMVQEDYVLVTWDFVSDPSTYGAFMKEISESKDIDPKLVCKSKVECLIYNILEELN